MSVVGQPISRVDGRPKATGGARYTADIPHDTTAHGAIIYSTIANGWTKAINTAAAKKVPGVLAVLTHKNMPRVNPVPWSHLHPRRRLPMPCIMQRARECATCQ
jgi:xanthine dehydrogenase YagR molybdenum-binding subunit